MKVKIINSKASSIFFDGKFYDTGKELDMDFSEAFRMTRVCDIETEYDSVSYNSALFKDEHFFNFYGDIDTVSGFGGCSYNLIKHSFPKYKIALAGKVFNIKDQKIFQSANIPLLQDGAMIWHDQPREKWLYTPFKKNICIIPFETTVIPRS